MVTAGPCLFGEEDLMASPSGWVDGGLPLQLVDASAPVEVSALWWGWGVLDDFEGMESASSYGKWSECNVLTATLKIFWWLLPVGDSGLRCRLSWLLGIRKLTGFWSEVLSSIFNSMLTSFLQVQRPCIEPVQTLCSLVFQANVLFSQIIFMLLKVLHLQILYSISVLKLFRVSDCYECLNLKVEQLIENRNIARFISEKVMWLLLVINY